MDTNWKHQKKAITTDQKNRTDDENLHELDKEKLNVNKKNSRGGQRVPDSASEDLREGGGLHRQRE